MKRSVLFLPALALALSVAVTGCGGGSDDGGKDASEPESSAPALSKAEFIEQADAICAAANTEIDTASADLGDAPTEEEFVTFATEVGIPNFQGQHDAIAELGAPEGDEETIESLLAALQEGIDTVSDDPAAFVTAESSPFDDANDQAQAYGLVDCAG